MSTAFNIQSHGATNHAEEVPTWIMDADGEAVLASRDAYDALQNLQGVMSHTS